MSKFGWDLPPGVTTNMLPGNTPADQAAEALADSFDKLLEKYQIKLAEEVEENFVLAVMKMVEQSHIDGYGAGHSDARVGEAYHIDWLKSTLKMARDALLKATHGDEYCEYMDVFNKIKEALDGPDE